MKFLFVIMALLLNFPAIAQAQDSAYITKTKSWFANLDEAQARFEQVDHYGQSIRGTFYIHRPGRLRFEYDAPIKDYIVADGYLIYFYDGDSETVNSGPIGSTMADFILRDVESFDEKITVESVREIADTVRLTLSQTDQPGTGQLILTFSKEPYELKSWQIIDAQGFTTDIILSPLDRAVDIAPSKFVFKQQSFN